VRLKTFLEMRGADSGPWNTLCALPAFWVGLLYDSTALDAAWDLVKDWTAEERNALRLGAARTGLKTPFRSGTLQDVAREVLAVSRKGLNARKRLNGHGENESLFLDDLDEIVKTGRTRAEDLIARFNGDWDGSIEPVFTEAAY
jgi:glutamate--cysteine ligase